MVLENTTSILTGVDINYLFGSLSTMLALSACVAGGLFQTIVKWWDKWVDGQPIAFEKKFIGTAVAAFVGSLMVAIPLVNASTEILNQNIPIYGLIIAWVITAGWAYALNNGVNGIVTKLEKNGENNLIKSGRLDALIERKVEERLAISTSAPLSSTDGTSPIIGGDDIVQPQS